MPALAWDTAGERYFEAGVDRGVLYVDGVGVPWNGLTTVQEAPSGGESKPYYFDGVKYLNIAGAEEYAATITSFGSPAEFAACDGTTSISNGLFATQQPRKSFNFAYRTRLGNDIHGVDHGYKLHLVYNALAAPTSRDNNSITDSFEPSTFSWSITTTPPRVSGLKPTAHLIVDSTKTPNGLLKAIEDILYGTDSTVARFPTAPEIVALFQSAGPVVRRNWTRNPRQDPSGSTTERNVRYGWTTSYTTDGDRLATRITRGTGSVGTDRGLDWYANADNPPGTTGTAIYVPVTAGETIQISLDSRSSVAGSVRRIKYRIHDGAGNWLTAIISVAVITTSTDWQRTSADIVIPNTGYLVVRNTIEPTTWSATDWNEQSNLYIGSPGGYFDGNTPDVPNYTYDWEGTAHNAPSTLRSWLV